MIERIVLTGGGSAGHVTPNLALIEALTGGGCTGISPTIDYIGSPDGIERELTASLPVTYHAVKSGKLRRYFSWQNFLDPFRLLLGVFEAWRLLGRRRPQIVFSKGGFVAVPVVVAAWLRGIPVIAHESDMTPGLANRLTYPFVDHICITFDETAAHLPAGKVRVTGTPVRMNILAGDPAIGLERLGLDGARPLLLVVGGSLGAAAINTAVRAALPSLLEHFEIAHLTGAGHVDSSITTPGYVQFEYLADGFGDVLAAASLVVSRAGANALCELVLTQTPHLLVPLTRAASRGDQLVNAAAFAAAGYSRVLFEEALTPESLVASLLQLDADRDELVANMRHFAGRNATQSILELLASRAASTAEG